MEKMRQNADEVDPQELEFLARSKTYENIKNYTGKLEFPRSASVSVVPISTETLGLIRSLLHPNPSMRMQAADLCDKISGRAQLS